jgi:hypothetical protein
LVRVQMLVQEFQPLKIQYQDLFALGTADIVILVMNQYFDV